MAVGGGGQHFFEQGLELGVGPVTSDQSVSIVQRFNKSRANYMRHAVKNLKHFEAEVREKLGEKRVLLDKYNKILALSAVEPDAKNINVNLDRVAEEVQAELKVATTAKQIGAKATAAVAAWKSKNITTTVDPLTPTQKNISPRLFELISVCKAALLFSGGTVVAAGAGVVNDQRLSGVDLNKLINFIETPTKDITNILKILGKITITKREANDVKNVEFVAVLDCLERLFPLAKDERDYKEKLNMLTVNSKDSVQTLLVLPPRGKLSTESYERILPVYRHLHLNEDKWGDALVSWFTRIFELPTLMSWGALNDQQKPEVPVNEELYLAFRAVVNYIERKIKYDLSTCDAEGNVLITDDFENLHRVCPHLESKLRLLKIQVNQYINSNLNTNVENKDIDVIVSHILLPYNTSKIDLRQDRAILQRLKGIKSFTNTAMFILAHLPFIQTKELFEKLSNKGAFLTPLQGKSIITAGTTIDALKQQCKNPKIWAVFNTITPTINIDESKMSEDENLMLTLRALCWFLKVQDDPVAGNADVQFLDEDEELLAQKQGGGGGDTLESKDIMKRLLVLQKDIDGMVSEYEVALRKFKDGIPRSLDEDADAKNVVRNVVEMYRNAQSNERELVKAQVALKEQIDFVRRAASAKDFDVRFNFVNEDHMKKVVDASNNLVKSEFDLRPSATDLDKFFDQKELGVDAPVTDADAEDAEIQLPKLVKDMVEKAMAYNNSADMTRAAPFLDRLRLLQKLMLIKPTRSEEMTGGAIEDELYDLQQRILEKRDAYNTTPSGDIAGRARLKADWDSLKRQESSLRIIARKYDRRGDHDRYRDNDRYRGDRGDRDGRRHTMRVDDLMHFYTNGSLSLTIDDFKQQVLKDQALVSDILRNQKNKDLIETLKKGPEGLQQYSAFSTFYRRLNDANRHLESLDWLSTLNRESTYKEPTKEFVSFIEDLKAVNDMKTRFLKPKIETIVEIVKDISGSPVYVDGKVVQKERTMTTFLPELQLDYEVTGPNGETHKTMAPSAPVVPAADIDKGAFTRILEMYRSAKPEDKRKAGERVVDIIDATPSLNPKKAVGLTFIDRAIFVVLTLAIRAGALRGTSALVNRNIVKSLRGAIVVYALLYSLLVLLLFAAVTLDDSVLRIAFNYLNPHANTGGVVLHLVVTWMLVLVVVSVLMAEQAPLQVVSSLSLSTAEKGEIATNTAAITFFAWFVTTFQVAVI